MPARGTPTLAGQRPRPPPPPSHNLGPADASDTPQADLNLGWIDKGRTIGFFFTKLNFYIFVQPKCFIIAVGYSLINKDLTKLETNSKIILHCIIVCVFLPPPFTTFIGKFCNQTTRLCIVVYYVCGTLHQLQKLC